MGYVFIYEEFRETKATKLCYRLKLEASKIPGSICTIKNSYYYWSFRKISSESGMRKNVLIRN